MGRFQSGQMDLTVNQVALRLRGFDPHPAHQKILARGFLHRLKIVSN